MLDVDTLEIFRIDLDSGQEKSTLKFQHDQQSCKLFYTVKKNWTFCFLSVLQLLQDILIWIWEWQLVCNVSMLQIRSLWQCHVMSCLAREVCRSKFNFTTSSDIPAHPIAPRTPRQRSGGWQTLCVTFKTSKSRGTNWQKTIATWGMERQTGKWKKKLSLDRLADRNEWGWGSNPACPSHESTQFRFHLHPHPSHTHTSTQVSYLRTGLYIHLWPYIAAGLSLPLSPSWKEGEWSEFPLRTNCDNLIVANREWERRISTKFGIKVLNT